MNLISENVNTAIARLIDFRKGFYWYELSLSYGRDGSLNGLTIHVRLPACTSTSWLKQTLLLLFHLR